jgi:F-type H+-transporting ATPase subunit b
MGETIEALGIYWPKLIAQTINFSIVLFVLWRWAYQPILALLEQRRVQIADSVANAQKIKEELAQTETARQAILNQANVQANQLIVEARAAAVRVQEVETQKAIAAAEQIISKAREATALDQARMMTELKREIGRLVVETTAQVAGKVLTADDQRRLIEETNQQLAA